MIYERLEMMGKILVVSILLALVYSWEEFKSSVKFVLRLLIYRDMRRVAYPKAVDRLVSMSISLGVIPIGLALFLEVHPFSAKNLIILAISFLGIAVAAMLASAIARRLAGPPYYQQFGTSAFMAVSLASLILPNLRFLADIDLVERKALSRFALFLSLPALVGLTLKFILGQSYINTQFLPALDLLIQILVMALLVSVTVSFLEQHLHSSRMRRFSHLFRILLGVLLSVALIFS